MPDYTHRNPAIQEVMRLLAPDPNLPDRRRHISEKCWELADWMVQEIHDNRELTVGLREILRAKDSLIRAKLLDMGQL